MLGHNQAHPPHPCTTCRRDCYLPRYSCVAPYSSLPADGTRHPTETHWRYPGPSEPGIDLGLPARSNREPAASGITGTTSMTRITPEELSRDIAEFLEFKRALGYTYQRSEATLCNFQRFAERYVGNDGSKCAVIELEPTINAWLSCVDGRKAVTASLYLGVVRQLCLYRQRRDPDSFVPDHALAPQSESSYFPCSISSRKRRFINF